MTESPDWMGASKHRRACAHALATAAMALGICAAAANPPTVVSLNVALDLEDLHPSATQGAIDCGAVLQPPEWIAVHQPEITNYDAFAKLVLSPAHYLGQERSASFPVTGRRFAGSVRADITLAGPATRPSGMPATQALIACWLMLNGRPAVWDQSGARLLASVGNFPTVTANPLIVATTSVGPTGRQSVAANLKEQGRFFVPGPLTLSATVQIGAAKSFAGARKSAAPQAAPARLVVRAPFEAHGGFVALSVTAVSTTLTGTGGFISLANTSATATMTSVGQFSAPGTVVVPTALAAGGNFQTP